MSVLRLVMITPRYWPLVGETERYVSHLAQALHGQAVTTILTARWDGSWPSEVVQRETRVVRLPHAPRGGWNRYRYMRSLSRWLQEHSDEIDLAYVMNLRQDAYAAIGALKDRGVAVAVRPQADDCVWLETARPGRRMRRRSEHTDALVASTRSLDANLLARGYPRERVWHIVNGAELPELRTAASRFAARAALTAANHDLGIAEYAPLVLSVARFEKSSHLIELVDAWRAVASRWPAARLWLLGDGPLRQSLYDRIVDASLHHHIFLPGSFDELVDVFHAADVFVSTAPVLDGGQILLEAMAAGLPVVATDTPDNRDIVEPGVHGLLVGPGDRAALATALETLLEAPQTAAEFGQAARRRVEQSYSQARAAEEHWRLFERLAAGK